jgi:thioredoxin 1
MKNVTKEELLTAIQGRVLVDFYADWCAECVALTPFLEEAEEECDIPILRFHCDADRELVMDLGIMSIPALLLFENGKEKARRIGLSTKEEILELTQK